MDQSRVFTVAGLDPAIATTVGYGRVMALRGHRYQVTGDVSMMAAGFDAHDYRARLGGQSSLLQWRAVHLNITRGTQNSIYRGVNFGADVTGSLGVYRRRGSRAANSASTRRSSRT